MIIGIGTDLVYIPRIAKTFERQGQKFLDRCFTADEISYALSARQVETQAARLAKRWAAKEACAKAMGSGIAETVTLKDIGVLHHSNKMPYLYLIGGAKAQLDRLAGDRGTPVLHLSLSDDGDYAQAFVVLSAEKD
ncbi:MAG: holo-ACP synthase [Pseudomonadota bacterium]